MASEQRHIHTHKSIATLMKELPPFQKTPCVRIYFDCVDIKPDERYVWLDAARPYDFVLEEIEEMITCFRNNSDKPLRSISWEVDEVSLFHDIGNEDDDLETLTDLARGIVEYGSAFVGYAMANYAEATIESFDDQTHGYYASEEDFIRQFYEDDKTSIPDRFIDWEGLTAYWFQEEYYSVNAEDGGVYVFNRHL